jgi:hypothetical protein
MEEANCIEDWHSAGLINYLANIFVHQLAYFVSPKKGKEDYHSATFHARGTFYYETVHDFMQLQ